MAKNITGRRKKFLIILVIIISVFIVVTYLTYFFKSRKKFVYEKSIDEYVMRVNDTEITLREFGCYIFDVEGFVQRQALIYDEADPISYWNTHYSAGMNSVFMRDYALKTAIGVCLQDMAYEQLAIAEGMELTQEETDHVKEETETYFLGMSTEVREILGLDMDVCTMIKLRKALALKYASDIASKTDLSGYGGTPETAMSFDGGYFKANVLPAVEVVYNKKITEGLKLGRITVNRE